MKQKICQIFHIYPENKFWEVLSKDVKVKQVLVYYCRYVLRAANWLKTRRVTGSV